MENFSPVELNRPKNLKKVMPELGASRQDGWRVSLDDLHFLEDFNTRVHTPEYEAHIQHIKNSIMANGFYASKPIEVIVQMEEGHPKLYVTDGHTRVTAARQAVASGYTLESVPVVAKPEGTSMEDIYFSQMAENDGRPFTPYERAVNIKRLVDIGVDIKAIAKRADLTAPYVSDLLSLMAAPKKVRDMVAMGQVTATTAIKELQDNGPKAAVERLTEGLKTAQAAGKEALTPKHLPKAPEKPATRKAPAVKLLGTVANITKGKITMNFDFALTAKTGFSVGDKVKLVMVEADEL